MIIANIYDVSHQFLSSTTDRNFVIDFPLLAQYLIFENCEGWLLPAKAVVSRHLIQNDCYVLMFSAAATLDCPKDKYAKYMSSSDCGKLNSALDHCDSPITFSGGRCATCCSICPKRTFYTRTTVADRMCLVSCDNTDMGYCCSTVDIPTTLTVELTTIDEN